MSQPTLSYHCVSRSERNELHTITVENGTVLCSCVGTEWCSHIEATLIYGESHMVPFEQWDTVRQARQFTKGLLHSPPDWKGHWQEDKVWRGLAPPRKSAMTRAIEAGRPTICFIGNGQLGSRFDYAQEATSLGWEVFEAPTKLLTLAICADNAVSSKKALTANRLSLPILPYDDWEEYTYEFTEQILDRIESYRSPPYRIAA